MDSNRIKHLEFVQNIITRMNSNSFQIKTWTITLVTGLLAVYSSTKEKNFILLTIFPLLLFWFLDSYYLNQERKFRGLYNDIISDDPKNEISLFKMRPDLYVGGSFNYSSSFFSKTIISFYLSIIIIMVGVYFFVNAHNHNIM